MSLLGVQGKLCFVDVNSIEAKLTEVTNRYNDAKRKIDEAKERLAASQREADNLKDNADTLVCSLILIP
jgi:chromosome segregation ATPase